MHLGLFLRVISKFGPNLARDLGIWAYFLCVIFKIWGLFAAYIGPILLCPKKGLGHVPQVPLS